MIRRAVPSPIEIPKLEERVLEEEDQRNAVEVERLETELDSIKRGHLDVFPPESQDDEESGELAITRNEVSASVELLNELTREKPSIVTSVVKNWMQDTLKRNKI